MEFIPPEVWKGTLGRAFLESYVKCLGVENIGFKLYCGITSEYDQERKQLDTIIDDLKKRYGPVEGENCYMILNFFIDDYEFDAVVIKKDRIIILEMKSLIGKITVNCKRGTKWTVVSHDKTYEPFDNPFVQAQNHRSAMAGFLKEMFNFNENQVIDLIYPFIVAWVVVENESEIEYGITQQNYKRWFNVFPIDIVPHQVTLETWKRFHLEEKNIQEIITLLGVEERDPDTWPLPPLPMKIEDEKRITVRKEALSNILNPLEEISSQNQEGKMAISVLKSLESAEISPGEIEKLFESPEPSKVREAVNMVAKLKLHEYLPQIILHKIHPNAEMRLSVIDAMQYLEFDDMIPLLIEFVNDYDWNVRKKALEVLVRFGDKEITPVLLTRLQNESINEGEVILIVKVLGEIGDERAVGGLIDLDKTLEKRFSGSKHICEIRSSIFNSLGLIGSHNAIPYIKEEMLKIDEFSWFREDTYIYTLGKIGHSDGIETILKYLDKENMYVRDAIWALGDIGDKRVVKYLHPFLLDDDYFELTLQTLGKIGAKESFDPIWEIFKNKISEEGEPFINTAGYLIDLDKEKMEDRLISLIKSGNDKLQDVGVWHIYEVVTDKSEEVLIPLLEDENLHYWALRALAILYRENIPEYVFDYLKSDNELLRESAVTIIGFNLKEDGLKYIVNLRTDDSEIVREIIVHIFKKIGTKQCIDYLVEMLDDESQKIQKTALLLLHDIGFDKVGNESVLPKLRKIQNTGSSEMKKLVGQAYRKIGNEECLEYLFDMLQDESQEVRLNSLNILEFIGKEKIIPTLNTFHLKPDRSIESLKKIEDFGKKLIKFLQTTRIEDTGEWQKYRTIPEWEYILKLIENIREMGQRYGRNKT